jgi:hypothetical protein
MTLRHLPAVVAAIGLAACGGTVESSGSNGEGGGGGAGGDAVSSATATSAASTGATSTGQGGGPVGPQAIAGTGVSSYTEISDGAVVPLIAGGQGGYHLWVGARCANFGAEAIIFYGIKDAQTGEDLSYSGLQQMLVLDASQTWTDVYGLIGYLNSYVETDYVGRSVQIWTKVQGLGEHLGESAEDAVTVTVGQVEYYEPI